jgi:hypothetical protein
MSFTDENLYRLKETIAKGKYIIEQSPQTLRELVARLEAAELALKVFRELESEKSSYDDAVSLYIAWRKAAGRQ